MKTPCYIIEEKELDRSLSGFKLALASYFSHYIPSYSVKTNSLPYVLKKACRYGYYAEVVSDDEYKLALCCGFKKDKIVFNGPQKSKELFLDALLGGAMVNIETFREIDWLENLQSNEVYDVGLRMNINISSISPADQNNESDDSRFGFSCESGDFKTAIDRLKKLNNIRINRIHLHRTSRTRSVSFYSNLIDYALTQLDKHDLKIEIIDIGGGFYGIMPGKPSFDDYVSAISKTIENHRDLSSTTIIIEPGNAIVASCFDFVASVIDVKYHDNSYYVTIDGSRIDVDPFFRKNSYFCDFQYAGRESDLIVPSQIIGGCTCLEYDRLMVINNQQLFQVGDVIRFHRVGAYTMTLTPLFIRYWPDVYVNDGQKLTLVREKFTAEKLLF